MARVERLDGNIGLLEIRPLLYAPTHAGPAVTAAMTLLASTDALLLDLRRCLGGSPDQVAFVCSHLVEPDDAVHLNDLVTPATGPGGSSGRRRTCRVRGSAAPSRSGC